MRHSRKLTPRDKLLAAARLFSDPLLPEQFFEGGSSLDVQGERKLMAAVLLDAVRAYAEHLDSPTAQGARLFREAQDWVFKDDFDWPFSFRNVCLTLDIEAERLRERLVRVREGGSRSRARGRLAEILGRVVAREDEPAP